MTSHYTAIIFLLESFDFTLSTLLFQLYSKSYILSISSVTIVLLSS